MLHSTNYTNFLLQRTFSSTRTSVIITDEYLISFACIDTSEANSGDM